MDARPLRWAFGLVGLLLVGLALAGVAYLAYNAGVSEGMAQATDLTAAELQRTAPRLVAPYAYGPFSWGFGFPGCLVTLFLFFLLFGGIRMLFAPWRMGGWHRGWGPKDPERWQRFRKQAEQWHREMHASEQRADEPAEA